MLGQQHQAQMPITATDIVNYTIKKTDLLCKDISSVIYWSRQQKVINQSNLKRLIFTSDFGTGKTILLKRKAFELTTKNWHRKKQKSQKKPCLMGPSILIENDNDNDDDDPPIVYVVIFLNRKTSLLYSTLKNDLMWDKSSQERHQRKGSIELLAMETDSKISLIDLLDWIWPEKISSLLF